MTEQRSNLAGHFPAADGIRGLAVLVVLVAHALVMFIPATRPYLGGTGKIGVWLFFVLSAFLLTNKFLKKGINIKSVSEYFLGRFLRILPLFFIASVFYFYMGYYNTETLKNVLAFQQGFAHLWTIPVEFKFYFMLPIFLIAFQAIKKRFGAFSVAFLAILITIAFRYFYPVSLLQENSIETRWYISSFIVGIILSYILRNMNIPPRKYGFYILALLFLILLIIPSFCKLITGRVIVPNLATSYLSISIVWAIFIYFSLLDTGVTSSILSSSLMRKIGNHSFSTYLAHWFVLTQLAKKYTDSIPMMLLSIVASLLLGAIIYFVFEKNIETFRHRVQKVMASPSK
ncbi:acyltransferase [Pantoea sp. ARC270]|uniref:acyltransferase family protein n=1 Tax=Pantoea sp. ARC270 TaxID=2027923 RepID=UPI001314299E|nr:acyltransferase [Pantoea sp. ARC270]